MKVNTEDLMGIRDIARAAGVGDAAVVNWRKRHSSFPKPIATISDGTPIFHRAQIFQWLIDTSRCTPEEIMQNLLQS